MVLATTHEQQHMTSLAMLSQLTAGACDYTTSMT